MDLDASPITLSIKILQATNCKGSKTSLNSFVRVQFADYDYKDTTIITDSLNPEYNFTFEQIFNLDESLVEVFSNKAVSFILHESLPKDKSAPLGVGEISLFKHFLAYFKRDDLDAPVPECPLSFIQKIPITYSNQKMLAANQEPPALSVEFALSRPLLSVALLTNSAFLTLTAEDVRPVPEDWTLKDGNEKDLTTNLYSYYISLKFPSSGHSLRNITIGNGSLCLADDKLSHDPIALVPQGIPLAESNDTEKNTEIRHPNGAEDSVVGGSDKLMVRWNHQYVIWLSPHVLNKLREESNQKVEVEFYRSPQTKFSTLVDPNATKYRAKSLIDFSLALNPTIIGIKGRYNLEAVESDANLKKDIFKTLGSTLGLRLIFSTPIISRKRLKQMTKSTTDYIPKRTAIADASIQKKVMLASTEYKEKIREIVNQLVGEYKETLKMELSLGTDSKGLLQTQNQGDEQKRKKLFLFHLNKSGAYFDMKEQLKASVVQIVRERFKKRSPFTGKSEIQLFMSEIYVYLMDEMHRVLNEIYNNPGHSRVSVDHSLEDFVALKGFADDAEWSKHKSIAQKYHQQRIAKFEDNLGAWFDYSAFCLRNQFNAIGEEGLREILSRNPNHLLGLLAHGMICLSAEKYEESRTFLEKCLELAPKDVIALTVMGIFCESINDDIEGEKYYTRAKNLGISRNFYQAAEFAIQLNCGDIADRALAQELVLNGLSVEPYLLLSNLEVQRENFGKALDALHQALEIIPSDPSVWAEIGHLNYIEKKYQDAKIAYETVLSVKNENMKSLKVDLVYLRLGHIYMRLAFNGSLAQESPLLQFRDLNFKANESSASIAKNMYLNASGISGTSQSWLGVGRACFALRQFDEAEDAFSEANIINNRDSEVWAHLSLLCLTVGRVVEANQAVAQAIRLGVYDTEILRLLGLAFLEGKQLEAAVECFRLGLQIDPSSEDLKEHLALSLRTGESVSDLVGGLAI